MRQIPVKITKQIVTILKQIHIVMQNKKVTCLIVLPLEKFLEFYLHRPSLISYPVGEVLRTEQVILK